MIRSKPVLTFVSLIALTLSYAHRDSTTVESVIKEGRDSSQAKAILVELCETVGPRTTGTPQCRAAEEWALMLGMSVVVVRSNCLRIEAQAFYEHLGYTITKTQNAFRKTLNGI